MRLSFKQRVTRMMVNVLGPEPIGAAGMDRLQGYLQRDLGGRETRASFGLSGGPELTFSGPMTNPQHFVGQTQMGAQGSNLPIDPKAALPNSKFPSGIPDAVNPPFADYMSYEGV